jgi:hypothetical protein
MKRATVANEHLLMAFLVALAVYVKYFSKL